MACQEKNDGGVSDVMQSTVESDEAWWATHGAAAIASAERRVTLRCSMRGCRHEGVVHTDDGQWLGAYCILDDDTATVESNDMNGFASTIGAGPAGVPKARAGCFGRMCKCTECANCQHRGIGIETGCCVMCELFCMTDVRAKRARWPCDGVAWIAAMHAVGCGSDGG